MLGWDIYVHKQTKDGTSPATKVSPAGLQLAFWRAEVDGLGWIEELVKAGKAIDLGGDGYPYRYTAKAEYIISKIIDEPPGSQSIWPYKIYDTPPENWKGGIGVDRIATNDCSPDEWLLIEAWDES